jgi:hypothetical protein
LNTTAFSDSLWDSFQRFSGVNDTSATFEVNRFGSFTANFRAPLDFFCVPEGFFPKGIRTLGTANNSILDYTSHGEALCISFALISSIRL